MSGRTDVKLLDPEEKKELAHHTEIAEHESCGGK
jgi:hypothetical protein